MGYTGIIHLLLPPPVLQQVLELPSVPPHVDQVSSTGVWGGEGGGCEAAQESST